MAGNMNIIGEDRFACVDSLAWQQAYHLARRYGWKPTGTKAAEWLAYAADDDADDWDSRYFYSGGQVVTAADAKALAEAIAKAMPDIPREASFGFSHLLCRHERLPPSERLTEDFLEYFASDPEARRSLREIEALASEGEFRIE